MTLHTKNHPHWSEGSWDNPVLSPPPSLEDLITDNAQLTEPGENKEPARNGFVEVVGGIFGEIIGGIGKILGGVWDAGVSFLGPVVEGVSNFLGGIVRGIGNAIRGIFGGSSGPPPVTEIDEPSVWSPIKADLEGALAPHFEKIDENMELSAALGESIDSLNAEVGEMNTNLGAINGRIDSINTTLDEKLGESGSILAEIDSLNDMMQEELGPNGTVGQQIEGLRQDLEHKISASGEVGQRMEALREDLESAREEDYRTINNALWGDQGQLNALNEEMWSDQSDLNKALTDFKAVQLQFNDSQTGFNAKMQEFNRLQLEFNEEQSSWNTQQEALNATNQQMSEELKERDDAIEAVVGELRDMQEETQEYIARMLPVPKNTPSENEHFEVVKLSNGNWRVKRKGTWVGQFVWQGVWTGDGQASLEVHDVGIKDQWDIVSFNNHPSLITYWIHEGAPVSRTLTNDGFIPDRYLHRTVMTFTVPAHLPEVTMSIYYRIGWDAATYDDWYNSRVTKNTTSTSDSLSSSYIVKDYGKRKNLGPLIPGQNGYRTMTINQKVQVKGGDVLRFQAHSSAEWTSQRLLRNARVEIGYVDPTQTS